jgi:peptidoglycan/xylan/chitin deacetylase (PgdA/CDA1 family)
MIGAVGAVAGLSALAFSLRFHWWRPAKRGVPILMYHQLGPHRAGSALNKWRVPESSFRRQVEWLARRGYRGISLRRLLDRNHSPAEKPVVITFDDGFDGVRSVGLPILREHGFLATVFVVAGRLGGVDDWNDERPREKLLDADGVRELAAAEFEIGSHGLNHRNLIGLDDESLALETAGSRRVLEEVAGAPVGSFCYPYGGIDDRAVGAVRDAGYHAATVIRSGICDPGGDLYRMRRIPVRGTDPLLDFTLALTRGRSKF